MAVIYGYNEGYDVPQFLVQGGAYVNVNIKMLKKGKIKMYIYSLPHMKISS